VKTHDLPLESVVGRKLRLRRIIASGGGGTVFEAMHEDLAVPVAVKVRHDGPSGPCPRRTKRFLREARVAARLQSPHAVRVLDVAADEGATPYIVMEYLEGETLQQHLKAAGPLPVATAVRHVLQALEALAEMHAAGIVHRDIKPSNLFLARRNDGTTLLKVLDFGLVTPDEQGLESDLTKSESAVGTPLYMAPEQYVSSKYVDARVDVWAIGVTLFELLTGRSPFHATTLAEVSRRVSRDAPDPLPESVPAELAAVIRGCLVKDPAERIGDVASLMRSLAPFAELAPRESAVLAFVAPESVRLPAIPRAELEPESPRFRRRSLLVLAAAAGVIVAAGALAARAGDRAAEAIEAAPAVALAPPVAVSAAPPPVLEMDDVAAVEPTREEARRAARKAPKVGHPSKRTARPPASHRGFDDRIE
jgi:serine/threonine protein kinase